MPTTVHHRFHNFHFTVPGSHISGKALFCAAFAAGAVFLVLMLALAPLMGMTPWAPTRLIAAITMGREALSRSFRFEACLPVDQPVDPDTLVKALAAIVIADDHDDKRRIV